MAARASDLGVSKAGLDTTRTFVLAVLAGAFIALGAMFATVVTAGAGDVPYGLARLAGGVVFTLGLVLVVVAGAELFTGNNLIVMAWADRRVTLGRLLRNWGSSTRATWSARWRPPCWSMPPGNTSSATAPWA